ncbi:MAG: AI-2E family transporter, partial [Anaerolineales bacterium]
SSGVISPGFPLNTSATRNLAWILVILVATYYLLQDWKRLRGWVVGVVPEAYQPDVRRLLREINNIWRAYLRGQLTWMLAVGVVVTIALLIIGTPGGVVLGVLTGLFSLLPDLGPAIAALLTVTVALFEGSSYLALSNLWFAALVIIVYLVAINAMNIFLRPRILGRSVKLHEGVVFIAIISAVVLQGVLGALIILPVISSTAVIGRYLRRRILGMPPFPEPVEPPPDESDGSSIESKDEN